MSRRLAACAGAAVLLGVLGWGAARKPAAPVRGRPPLAAAGPRRKPAGTSGRTGRAARTRVPPAARASDLAEICSGLEGSPDAAAREERFCDQVAPWLAAHSHAAGKIVRELDLPRELRLRLEAQLMAERDFASAYAWADRLPDPADRASALSSVLYEAAAEAPREVLDLARDSDLGPRRELVLGTLVANWSRTDAAAAAAWLRSLGGER